MASLFSLDFFSCFAFLITVPQLDCPYPHQFSEKIPFHILFSFSLCIFVYSTLHLRPLPHRQVRALGSSCAAKLPIFSSEVLPALHPLSKFLPGLLPYVRLAPAARSSVHAFAFSWLRNRSGHQSWLVCTIVQQHLPGRCVLPPQALLPGCGPDGKSEGAARGPPARTHQAAGERASGFAAGARATLHPRRGLGGGGVRGGGGGRRGRAASAPGCVRAPATLTPHALGPGGKARGRWCPCRWAWKPLCSPCCALCISASWVLSPERVPPDSEASVPRWRENKRGFWNLRFTSNQLITNLFREKCLICYSHTNNAGICIHCNT